MHRRQLSICPTYSDGLGFQEEPLPLEFEPNLLETAQVQFQDRGLCSETAQHESSVPPSTMKLASATLTVKRHRRCTPTPQVGAKSE